MTAASGADVELAQVADEGDAAVAVSQQVLHGVPGTTSVVRQYGGTGEARLIVADGHDGLARVTNSLQVVPGDGVGNRYEAGNSLPADVGQVVQGDLLVVVDARGHRLHGQDPATGR